MENTSNLKTTESGIYSLSESSSSSYKKMKIKKKHWVFSLFILIVGIILIVSGVVIYVLTPQMVKQNVNQVFKKLITFI